MLATLIPVKSVFPAESASDEETFISEVVVTAQRRRQPKLLHAGNIDRLDATAIEAVLHQHVHELLGRVAGVWVPGSGDHTPDVSKIFVGETSACQA